MNNLLNDFFTSASIKFGGSLRSSSNGERRLSGGLRHKLCRLTAFVICYVVLINCLSVTETSAQQPITVYHGSSLGEAPDGFYRLNISEGFLQIDSAYLDFQKTGSTVEGGALTDSFNIGGGYSSSRFCFKGEISGGKINFTRSFVLKARIQPNLSESAQVDLSHNWLLRPLAPSEVSQSYYQGCEVYHSVSDDFEELYKKAEEYNPYWDAGAEGISNTNGRARVALKTYREQVKRATDEILSDLYEGRITAREAKIRAAFLTEKLVTGSGYLSTSIGRATVEAITGSTSKNLRDALNQIALEDFKHPYRDLPVLQKAGVARKIFARASRILLDAEKLDGALATLGTACHLLKYFDIALMVTKWLTSENAFADIIADLTKMYTQSLTQLGAIAVSESLCVFGGPVGIIGCTAFIVIASGIGADIAADYGINLVKEWFVKPQKFFDNFVFLDWFSDSWKARRRTGFIG